MQVAQAPHDPPPYVRAIGYTAFFDCEALEEAELTEVLEQVGVNAFWDCMAR